MKSCKNFEQLIQNLIFDDISEVERNLLNVHVQKCEHCSKILELHTALRKSNFTTANKLPDNNYFQTIRQNVLRQVKTKRIQTFNLSDLFRRKKTILRPAYSIVVFFIIFLIGYYSHHWFKKDVASDRDLFITKIRQAAMQNRSLADVDKSPFLISQVRMERTDQGEIHLTFNVTTAVEYFGDLDDPLVKEVVTQALVNYTNDGSRLDAIALSTQLMDTKVKEALIFSMLHNENPAVRMNAMDVLGQMQLDDQIQQAIIKVLNSEQTVQMRLAAIELLTQENTYIQNLNQILQEKIERDPNSSVKLKAARSLQKIERR